MQNSNFQIWASFAIIVVSRHFQNLRFNNTNTNNEDDDEATREPSHSYYPWPVDSPVSYGTSFRSGYKGDQNLGCLCIKPESFLTLSAQTLLSWKIWCRGVCACVVHQLSLGTSGTNIPAPLPSPPPWDCTPSRAALVAQGVGHL